MLCRVLNGKNKNIFASPSKENIYGRFISKTGK